MNTNTKIGALVLSGVVLSGAIGAAIGVGVADDSKQVAELQSLIEAKQAKILELESAEPIVINNTVVEEVEVEKEVIVEKLVDNGNLEAVIEDYEGEELDADEIAEIVDTVIFKNDITVLAEQLVEAELVDFMDDEDMFGEGVLDGYRDNDVYSISIDEDESVIEDVDFDDKDATVYVEAKLKLNDEDDKLRVTARAEVEVRDGELEIVNVEILE